MNNIQNIQSSNDIKTKLSSDISRVWKIGQLLNATAHRSANAHEMVLMRMGNTFLEAKTPIALHAGDPIKLLIKSLGEKPVLSIVTSTNTGPPTSEHLKHYIAQQHKLHDFLRLSHKVLENVSLPKLLKQQLSNLSQQLPSAQMATQAKSLKKLIQNSGILLESKLKVPHSNEQQQKSLHQDIKSQLLTISSQIKHEAPQLSTKPHETSPGKIHLIVDRFVKGEINIVQFATQLSNQLSAQHNQLIQQVLKTTDINLLPKELFTSVTALLNHIQQSINPHLALDQLYNLLKSMDALQQLKSSADSSLAKITSQQLMSIARDDNNLLSLIFDLVLKDKTDFQTVHFHIEEEQTTKDNGESNWAVVINFNFEVLGHIQAKLHLIDNNISTVLHAEKTGTEKIISDNIDLLNTALSNIGFDGVNLNITQGIVHKDREVPRNLHLLDVTA